MRGRRSFAALRRSPRRGRSGPVSLTWIDDGTVPPRVAFAVGRWAGNAVARNRVRRRLRAAVAAEADSFASGQFLLGARAEAADLPFARLRAHVASAKAAAGAPHAAGAR